MLLANAIWFQDSYSLSLPILNARLWQTNHATVFKAGQTAGGPTPTLGAIYLPSGPHDTCRLAQWIARICRDVCMVRQVIGS